MSGHLWWKKKKKQKIYQCWAGADSVWSNQLSLALLSDSFRNNNEGLVELEVETDLRVLLWVKQKLQGALQEEGGNQIHHQWAFLLQPGADNKRGRRRRCAFSDDQGFEDGMAAHVQELGPKLAEQQLPKRPEPVLQGHNKRRPKCGVLQRRSFRLVFWTDLQWCPIPLRQPK